MRIGAHDQKIDAAVGKTVFDDLGWRLVEALSDGERHLDAVAGKSGGDIGSRQARGLHPVSTGSTENISTSSAAFRNGMASNVARAASFEPFQAIFTPV